MCPPANFPLSDIGACWTDEELITFLYKVQRGSTPPSNVIVDVNPFEHQPSNLPDNVWYYIQSAIKKVAGVGSWKAAGDSCQIYDDPKLNGWRLTLEFYEGPSNNERKTDWVMQEYWITQKEKGDLKASGSLCRIFPCDEECRKNKRQRHIELACVGGQEKHLLEEPNSFCPRNGPTSVSEVNVTIDEAKSSDALNDVDEFDCLSRGDYLELLDLVNPRSSTSSSCNSSCVSMASDEFFDYLALLNDLEPDTTKQDQPKSASCSSSISKPSIPIDMVMLPDVQESLVSCYESQSPGEPLKVEDVRLSPGTQGKPDDNSAEPHAELNFEAVPPKSPGALTSHRSVYKDGKRRDVVTAEKSIPPDTAPANSLRPDETITEMLPVQDQKDDLPNSQNDASSSERSVIDKGKKPSRGKMKRLGKKYLCFMPF